MFCSGFFNSEFCFDLRILILLLLNLPRTPSLTLNYHMDPFIFHNRILFSPIFFYPIKLLIPALTIFHTHCFAVLFHSASLSLPFLPPSPHDLYCCRALLGAPVLHTRLPHWNVLFAHKQNKRTDKNMSVQGQRFWPAQYFQDDCGGRKTRLVINLRSWAQFGISGCWFNQGLSIQTPNIQEEGFQALWLLFH